ncbi:MAG: PhzF family phenazine biosynthesis protein [Gemmatimonadota bacterium]|nr:PhzF family phenazine biosynthesis protein [Gemmatimonadota bacterium]
MSTIRYITSDVFTGARFGGNQLAVIPDATGIPEELLLPICREFNYSETTFVYPPEHPGETRRVRIFTPGGELPFAGHPTIGTAVVLAATGEIATHDGTARIVFGEGVGPVPVEIRGVHSGGGWAQLSAAKMPELGPPVPSRSMLAKMLGLTTDDILATSERPQAVSCGLPFLIVPLTSVSAVSRARVNVERWEETLANAWASMIWVYAADAEGGDRHYRARMFAPGINVPEDPATGSAAVTFAGFLAARSRTRNGSLEWTIDQGIEMGRPSRLAIEADKVDGNITALRVGGEAVLVSEGTMRI